MSVSTNPLFRDNFKKILLLIFSRPYFFDFLKHINRACLFLMNRSSATCFTPQYTGERLALEYALKSIDEEEKLFIFDVGGNCGDYMEMAGAACEHAKRDYKIFVFEPSSYMYSILQTKKGESEHIDVHKLAVSDQNSESNLFSPWNGCAGASLVNLDYYEFCMPDLDVSKETVETVTIDYFCQSKGISKIDFLKLDIEGLELSAINGAKQMIENRLITYIQVEIGAASITTKSILFDFWKKLHELYNFYLILNQGLMRIKKYEFDIESFYGASNFLLELKQHSLQPTDKTQFIDIE